VDVGNGGRWCMVYSVVSSRMLSMRYSVGSLSIGMRVFVSSGFVMVLSLNIVELSVFVVGSLLVGMSCGIVVL